MISTFTLLLLTLTVVSVSSQQVQYQNQTHNSTLKFNVSSANQDYIDGCKAVLQAKDSIYASEDTWKTTFSTWKNKYSYGSFMDFFENDQGIVSKVWIYSEDWSSSWIFNLTFYDGEYVDKKFARVEFYLSNVKASDFIQEYGTYQAQHLTAYVAYGENNRVQYTHDLQGQISLYFFNTNTNQPITDFSITDYNIQGDTVQITFSSSGSMLSFTTSGFTDTYSISTFELIMVSAFTLIYVIWSLCSAGTSELITRVSIGYVAFTYASSAYIVLWIFLHIQYRDNLLLLIPLSGAVIDWIKQAIFIFQKNYRSPCGLIIFMTILSSVLNFVPSIWVNLFPAVTLIFPFLVKLAGGYNHGKPYLNRFHICNWICMSLWIGYFYLYPTNILLISPQPLLVAIFFGIILVQFLLSSVMEKYQRRSEQHLLMMLLADPEAQPNQIYQPLLQNNQNAAAGRNNRNNAAAAQGPRGRPQANPNREKKPRRKAFKYTFAAQGAGGQEDYTELTDECAICFDYLLGDQPEKLYKTPCGHLFHEGCLRAWGVKKLECPCCRKRLPKFKRSPIN